MSDNLKVWRAFERETGDSVRKYEVRGITEPLWAETVEFMLGSYIREDVWWKTAEGKLCCFRQCILLPGINTSTFNKTALHGEIELVIHFYPTAKGTAADPEAVKEYRVLLTSIVQLNLSIGCFLLEPEGPCRLVAVNMCMPQVKGQFVEHVPPKSRAGLLSLRMFTEAMKVSAIYDKFRVSEYLMGAGLSVAPDQRNLGITRELLKSRVSLSKSLGFRATGGVFTSAGAQRAAAAAGWLCCHAVSYRDFGNDCDIEFDGDTENLMLFATYTV